MRKIYQYSVLGGTFDHLHKGHKKLIDEAFRFSSHVTIGQVAENLYKNKLLASTIEPYTLRKKSLIDYLKSKSYETRTKIIPIVDIFGTTLKDKKLEAIFVTQDTRTNAIIINNERKKRSLKPLEIISIPMVLAKDGKPITSERIRMGEIDREGKNYQLSVFSYRNEELLLPESLRPSLQKPLGKLLVNFSVKSLNLEEVPMVVAVGDIISMSLEKEGYIPDLKVVDFRSRRKAIKGKFDTKLVFSLSNKPGTINVKAAQAIKKAVGIFLKTHQKQTIVVEGEEDLLALPAILFAPLESVVLYGQMDRGVVSVEVTEVKKHEIVEIINKFT